MLFIAVNIMAVYATETVSLTLFPHTSPSCNFDHSHWLSTCQFDGNWWFNMVDAKSYDMASGICITWYAQSYHAFISIFYVCFKCLFDGIASIDININQLKQHKHIKVITLKES